MGINCFLVCFRGPKVFLFVLSRSWYFFKDDFDLEVMIDVVVEQDCGDE